MKEEKANVESDLLNQNRNLTKNFAISPNSAISQKRITITAKNLHVIILGKNLGLEWILLCDSVSTSS